MSTGNWKYKIDYGIADIYKFYKSEQNKNNKEVVDEKIFKKVIKTFNKLVTELIVEESYEFRMPKRLGYIRIRKHKTRIIIDANGKLKTGHLHPDWKATKELWSTNEAAKKIKKIVYHTNKHTQGYYCKWYWDKRTCNIKNNTAYSLVMSRTNKRRIAQAINNNENIDYYE